MSEALVIATNDGLSNEELFQIVQEGIRPEDWDLAGALLVRFADLCEHLDSSFSILPFLAQLAREARREMSPVLEADRLRRLNVGARYRGRGPVWRIMELDKSRPEGGSAFQDLPDDSHDPQLLVPTFADVERAMELLSPSEKRSFLRKFEGHSNKEIARVLRTTPQAVAVFLIRARHKLQNQLREGGAVGSGAGSGRRSRRIAKAS